MKHDWQLYGIVVLILDIFSMIMANIISVWLRFDSAVFERFFQRFLAAGENRLDDNYYTMLLLVIPIFIMLNAAFKLYRMSRTRDAYKEAGTIIVANLLGALILMSITFITKQGWEYSRLVLAIFIGLNIIFDLLLRGICRFYVRRLYKKGLLQRRIAVVGTGHLAEVYIHSIKNIAHWGYKLEGIVLTEADEAQERCLGYPVLGHIDDLYALNQQYCFDEIVVALHFNEAAIIKKLVNFCDLEGIRVKIVPVYYEFLQVSACMEDIDGLSLIVVRGIPLDSVFNRFLKRVFDIVFSLFFLIVISPVLLLVAIGIKLTAPGSVLYKQTRVSMNSNTFEMIKFRSMVELDEEEEALQWTTEGDSRKTKFGTFLRKTSLDELPQFFNVLKGDMSVVGPRPERPFWVNKFKDDIPEYMLRHYVKTGITGWAQINGWRGDTSIVERIKCDNYYIQNWSLWLDIKICLLTLFKVFRDKNAY